MNYVLQALVLQSNPAVPIEQSTFDSLKQSRKALTAAFALEEIYDLLLANFRELELSALEAAVTEMTAWRTGYDNFFEVRSVLNRRALNLLSAARLYLDQFPQWMKEAGASPEQPRNRAHAVYDASFQYRFMEALRNHVQHVGMAVHGVNMRSDWSPKVERKHLQFSIAPYASRVALTADEGFKKSVLQECPETVAILPAARAYVGGISEVHKDVRELVAPLAEAARHDFESAIKVHEDAAHERLPGLTALAIEAGRTVDTIPIFLQWDDVRVALHGRNKAVTNLSQRYVSGKAGNDA